MREDFLAQLARELRRRLAGSENAGPQHLVDAIAKMDWLSDDERRHLGVLVVAGSDGAIPAVARPPGASALAVAFRLVLLVVASYLLATRAGLVRELAFSLVIAGTFIWLMWESAVHFPRPSDHQAQAMNVVFALVASSEGLVLPGAFEFEGELLDLSVRGGSALGLFVLVLLWRPVREASS